MIKVIEVAETPNPDALKFILEAPILAAGAKSFENAQAGEKDSLAAAIFAVGPVASVFYMDRFVTVTRFPDVNWDFLYPKIKDAIEAKALPAPQAVPGQVDANGSGAEENILDKINQVIDENVRPALASDGGGLEILGLNDHVLTVHYQGACGSCPSASAGTLFAIQNLLQRMVDPRIEVVSA